MAIDLTINGRRQQINAPDDTPLLWALRDELRLTGTKFGCGVAACGACTVHVDGAAVRACQITLADLQEAEVTTIEGISGAAAKSVQHAWRKLDVVQCGYCQSGQIMSAIDLLEKNKAPSDADIDAHMAGNVCRCATYHRIRAAIHHAAETL